MKIDSNYFHLLGAAAAVTLFLGASACAQQSPLVSPAEAAPGPGAGPEGALDDKKLMAENESSGLKEGQAKTNEFWWPERLSLDLLRDNAPASNPFGAEFDYAKAFAAVDLPELKREIEAVLTTSQDWWPADYGNYGPFFIRMAWHSAGTYRVSDGRGGAGGGQQRFEPLNSWPDNANLDKARRLLWPIKQKYGRNVSWADLMVLAGNVAMENMGFETLGFAGGREDTFEPELVYWGPETKMLADARYKGDRKPVHGLAAVQMGLIYVNPEGPNGNPDPLAAAQDIRETFGRMAMNDEETVALIAGGHTFGKAHGAHKPDACLEPEPAATGVENQGIGWKNNCGKGNAEDTVTSGLEGAWTSNPDKWTHQYLANLHNFEWEKTKSPAGATQWKPTAEGSDQLVPDAHVEGKRHAPIMFTTDLALRADPSYAKITKRFMENPKEFEAAFARAWFKLTHRDMGPRARYIGSEVPSQQFIWQDPLPAPSARKITGREAAGLKKKILASGLTVPELVRAAWASASTYRDSDKRGGANGARVRLAPQKDWAVNAPAELGKVIAELGKVQAGFNRGSRQVSMADLIVLGGAAAIEKAAADAGVSVKVPFVPGRVDATAEMTDAKSFAHLEPQADGFRNYYGPSAERAPADLLVDKADLLDLSVPEMAVLVGGLRTLNANYDGAKHGVFTDAPGTLSNDFFVNLLDMSTQWSRSEANSGVLVGKDRNTGAEKWTATEVDLVFGSNAELRAVAEAYAFEDAKETFVKDFVAAWAKVMQADRFELDRRI